MQVSAALFVVVLVVSAWFDKSIRVLHLFEALPYLASPLLSRKRPKMGYMLGFASGTFWLWTAGFLTTFIWNGFERVIMLLSTGSVDRPDILLAVPGFIGTFGLVLASVVGYLSCKDKVLRDLLWFAWIVFAVSLFFLGIFAAFAPQYLGMFTHLF